MLRGSTIRSWRYYDKEENETNIVFSMKLLTRKDKTKWDIGVVYLQLKYIESLSKAIMSVNPIMSRQTQKVIYGVFDDITIEDVDSVSKIFEIFDPIKLCEFQIGTDTLKCVITIGDRSFTIVNVAEDMSYNSYTSSIYISDGLKQYLVPSSSFDCEKMVVDCVDLNKTTLGHALLKYNNLKDVIEKDIVL